MWWNTVLIVAIRKIAVKRGLGMLGERISSHSILYKAHDLSVPKRINPG